MHSELGSITPDSYAFLAISSIGTSKTIIYYVLDKRLELGRKELGPLIFITSVIQPSFCLDNIIMHTSKGVYTHERGEGM